MATLPVLNAKSAPDAVLRSVFLKYDHNGDGRISIQEGQQLMYDLGYYLSPEEFALTVGGDGKLNFEEFKQAWKKINSLMDIAKIMETEDGKKAVEYFQYYDAKKDGHLDHAEFRAMFENLVTYELTNGHTCDEILGTLGKDGKIDFNEYLQFMGYITATPR